jgi:7-cyano-7-deazaguanine synthase
MKLTGQRAVILLSGGLDSATVLAMARAEGLECYALSFDYGQRHRCELQAAHRVAASLGVREHRIFDLNLRQFGGSALTDDAIAVPDAPLSGEDNGIPVTYVPARNTVFLSLALAWAEVLGARDIFIGVNSVDYSGYPDCRPEYIAAYQAMANLATKEGVEGGGFQIITPLISLTKAEIIQQGSALGVDYGLTVSCYNPDEDGAACGQCDSCSLRREGFKMARIPDPTRYSR